MVFANHINNAPIWGWHTTCAKGIEIDLIDLKNAINLVAFHTVLPIHQQIDKRCISIVLFFFFDGNKQHFSTVTRTHVHSQTAPIRFLQAPQVCTQRIPNAIQCILQNAYMRRRKNNNENYFALALTIQSTFFASLFDLFFFPSSLKHIWFAVRFNALNLQ